MQIVMHLFARRNIHKKGTKKILIWTNSANMEHEKKEYTNDNIF